MVKYVEAVNDNDWHPKFLKDMDRMDTIMKCRFFKKTIIIIIIVIIIIVIIIYRICKQYNDDMYHPNG